MNILDKITTATKARVDLEKKCPLPPAVAPLTPFSFERQLYKTKTAIICEIKKASPSKGIITEDFSHLNIAREYELAGADAISVLTEPRFFLGKDHYLSDIRNVVSLPLLRKDFIVDSFQIEQSSCLGADAILLICAILTPLQLKDYIDTADNFGLSCLVETHSEAEVETALKSGARIIGVNNRDLKTFEVDIHTSIRLRKMVPDDVCFVSESGIRTSNDIQLLRSCNINAVLVGETLMRAADKSAMLKNLRG